MRHNYVPSTCQYCGAPFNARADLVKIGRGQYCSRTCSARSRAPQSLLVNADTSGGSESCWIWLGYRERHGYGRVTRRGKRVLVHRAVYEELVGPIPHGLDLLHSCDNVACVNPAHLHPGTHDDNMKEMAARGRSQRKRGSEKDCAIIDEEIAADIKRMLADGYSAATVANTFGVTKHIAADIQRGKTWRHVYASTKAQPFGAGAKEAA